MYVNFLKYFLNKVGMLIMQSIIHWKRVHIADRKPDLLQSCLICQLFSNAQIPVAALVKWEAMNINQSLVLGTYTLTSRMSARVACACP